MARTRFGSALDPQTGAFPGERVFVSSASIRYVLERPQEPSPILLVLFSGARAQGAPARYNWYRATEDLECARLYLLDDAGGGDPPGPSWYLGRHGSGVSESICELVRRTAEELELDRSRVLTAGSSMGGWAALYYGVRVGAGHVIAGEPQTMLGDYLCWSLFEAIARHLVGGAGLTERALLNGLLFDAIRAAPELPHVHLAAGHGSPYREHHIAPLSKLLDELAAQWELELFDYDEHSEISKHFPTYLATHVRRALTGAAPPASIEHGQR